MAEFRLRPPFFPPCPAAATAGDHWAGSVAVNRVSLTLQPPAWHRPVAKAASQPLVIVGYDHVPPPVRAAP